MAVSRALRGLHEAVEDLLPVVKGHKPPPLIYTMDWNKFHLELHADQQMCDSIITLKHRHKEGEHGGNTPNWLPAACMGIHRS
jgi:hypothetical protein